MYLVIKPGGKLLSPDNQLGPVANVYNQYVVDASSPTEAAELAARDALGAGELIVAAIGNPITVDLKAEQPPASATAEPTPTVTGTPVA